MVPRAAFSSLARPVKTVFVVWRTSRSTARTSRSTPGAAVGTAEVKAAKANVAKTEIVENEGIEEMSRH